MLYQSIDQHYLKTKIKIMKSIISIFFCTLTIATSAQDNTATQDNNGRKDKKDKMEHYMPMMVRGIGVSLQKFSGLKERIEGFPQ